MADVRMQSSAMPAAPPRYDQQNEADFRRLVGMLTSRVDNAMQRLREDTLADDSLYSDADADARIALATLADLASADASELDAGVLANARVQESNVTQHQAALSIAGSQLTGEIADARLSSNVPLLDVSNAFTDFLSISKDQTAFRVEADGGANCLEEHRRGTGVWQMRLQAPDGTNRWIIQLSTDDDDGDNDGGEISFLARTDAGGSLGTPLRLGREAAGGTVGFYGATPTTQQTGVAVTASAIHAALVNLGLITA